MKKDILFVMNNLDCGGAEKALISLLETIDYSKYNVDLFLFQHKGIFLAKVPQQVNVLSEPQQYQYFDMSIKTATIDCIKRGKYGIAFSRLRAGLIFKTEKNPARCEQRVWQYLSRSLNNLNKEYDVAIGYLEKNPIYFCVDKVNAKKKIGFIHTDYDMLKMDSKIDLEYFNKLNHLITISEESAKVLKQKFPTLKNKVGLIYNIVSPTIIRKLSLDEIKIKDNGVNIVSVGRLHTAKGFELAIDSCRSLIDKGYCVNWYVIGEGNERPALEALIREKNLQENFILLGFQDNPYPYIKSADIYVQPSRFEGKSIAIDEAKILKKPIIVTNFNTAKDQINHEANGLIVHTNAEAITEGIERLINDEGLKVKFINNLSAETLGTESEIQKLYELFHTG